MKSKQLKHEMKIMDRRLDRMSMLTEVKEKEALLNPRFTKPSGKLSRRSN